MIFVCEIIYYVASIECTSPIGSLAARTVLDVSNTLVALAFACLFEGKRVPTFPVCLCRKGKKQRPLSGLQFTPALGNALQLLTKHGLEHKRKKDSPVEVAIESLLSTSPLEIASAPDMDLVSCIDFFLENCVADTDNVPVGRLLRAGSQRLVAIYDVNNCF